MRTLTITAAEWASVQHSPAEASAADSRHGGGSLWLVREGVTWGTAHLQANHPPVEFVQACAPCETCGDDRTVVADDGRGGLCDLPCPDCRIELVGSPIAPELSAAELERRLKCAGPYMTGTTALGYAYAVGSPLPILDDFSWVIGSPAIVVTSPTTVHFYDGTAFIDITAALAYYGPPESLVGKWALQVQVVT